MRSQPVRNQPQSPADQVTRLAVAYLARQDRTAHQLAQYLLRKGAAGAAVEHTVARCRELGYLDDGAFARRWAEARLAKYPVGAARLRDELLAKGVASAVVSEVVRALYPRNQERALAEQTVRSAERRQGRVPIRKLAALLGSRGFDEDVIEAVLEQRMARSVTAARAGEE